MKTAALDASIVVVAAFFFVLIILTTFAVVASFYGAIAFGAYVIFCHLATAFHVAGVLCH